MTVTWSYVELITYTIKTCSAVNVLSRPNLISLNKWASTAHCRNVGCAFAHRLLGLAMTLTCGLWSCKPFEQCSLTWWIVRSFIKIPLLTMELLHDAKYVNGRTDSQTDNRTTPCLSPPIVGSGCIKLFPLNVLINFKQFHTLLFR